MRYLVILLLVLLSVGFAHAQATLVGPRELLLPLPQAMMGELSPVPDGQMRIMLHWHTLASDGYCSAGTSSIWAERYGAQMLMITDHAHVLGQSESELDLYDKGPLHYKIVLGKPIFTGPSYLKMVAGVRGPIPVSAWLEIGEESHFLVFPGYGRDMDEVMTRLVELGCKTKTLGTQKVIDQIDKILQETGGFMIEAHPMNSRYPFNYNFDGCQCAVGVEFFNGPRSEHWRNFDRLLEVQRHTARPVIATAGVDLHVPEGAAGEFEGAAGKGAAQSFFKGQLDDIISYRPSQRFTYTFGVSQDPIVIACQIRDGYGYCATGNTVITGFTSGPGTKFCPPRGTDVSYITTRGLPDSVKVMRVAFVDDETGEISENEVPWVDDYTGTRMASFSINKLRHDPTHPGKLFMATTEFVTSAVIVLGNPEALAEKIAAIQRGDAPQQDSPAAPPFGTEPAPPAQVQQPAPATTQQPISEAEAMTQIQDLTSRLSNVLAGLPAELRATAYSRYQERYASWVGFGIHGAVEILGRLKEVFKDVETIAQGKPVQNDQPQFNQPQPTPTTQFDISGTWTGRGIRHDGSFPCTVTSVVVRCPDGSFQFHTHYDWGNGRFADANAYRRVLDDGQIVDVSSGSPVGNGPVDNIEVVYNHGGRSRFVQGTIVFTDPDTQNATEYVLRRQQ